MNKKFIALAAGSTSSMDEGATHGGQDVTAVITSDSNDNGGTASVYTRGGSAMFVPTNAYVGEEGCSGFKQSCRGRKRCCATDNDGKALECDERYLFKKCYHTQRLYEEPCTKKTTKYGKNYSCAECFLCREWGGEIYNVCAPITGCKPQLLTKTEDILKS